MPSRSRQLHRNLDDIFGRPGTYECRVCGGDLSDGRMNYCGGKCRSVAYGVSGLFQWNGVRKRVLERDGHQCVRCGATEDLHVDHIRPLAKSGPALDEANLQTLCERCNGQKGTDIVDYRGDDSRGLDVRQRVLTAVYHDERESTDLPDAVRVLAPERFATKPQAVAPPELDSPDRPDLPEYLLDPVDRQDPAALRELIAYAGERLEFLEAEQQREEAALGDDFDVDGRDPSEFGVDEDRFAWAKVYQKLKDCNKPSCSQCPHGPYPTLFYRLEPNGDLRSKHIPKGSTPG